MKFFIDTANLEQIREANALGVLDGVTTNPSLMAKEGIKGVENQHKHYIEICNIVDGDVSAEVIATDYEEMIREGGKYFSRLTRSGRAVSGLQQSYLPAQFFFPFHHLFYPL